MAENNFDLIVIGAGPGGPRRGLAGGTPIQKHTRQK